MGEGTPRQSLCRTGQQRRRRAGRGAHPDRPGLPGGHLPLQHRRAAERGLRSQPQTPGRHPGRQPHRDHVEVRPSADRSGRHPHRRPLRNGTEQAPGRRLCLAGEFHQRHAGHRRSHRYPLRPEKRRRCLRPARRHRPCGLHLHLPTPQTGFLHGRLQRVCRPLGTA